MVESAAQVDLDGAVGELDRKDEEGGLVDVVDSGCAVEGHLVGE